MKKYIIIPCIVSCFNSFAQAPQDMQVIQLQDISTFYNTTADLEQAFTYQNAIGVTVPAGASDRKLYWQVQFATQPNEKIAQQLILKRNGQAFPGVSLSTMPKLIQEIPASANPIELIFDMLVLPHTRQVQPGSYTYSLKFTISTL